MARPSEAVRRGVCASNGIGQNHLFRPMSRIALHRKPLILFASLQRRLMRPRWRQEMNWHDTMDRRPGWRIRVRIEARLIRVTVTEMDGEELLKARLPRQNCDARALLRLLESVALWSGGPVCAAVSVAGQDRTFFDWASLSDELTLTSNALVRVVRVGLDRRRQLSLRTWAAAVQKGEGHDF